MAPSITMLMLAIFFGVVGFAGKHMVERRRFHRRNHAAVEEFRNYTAMVGMRGFEGVIHGTSRLLLAAAVGLLFMFGIVRCRENDVRAKEPDGLSGPCTKEGKRRVRPAAEISSHLKEPSGTSVQHPGL